MLARGSRVSQIAQPNNNNAWARERELMARWHRFRDWPLRAKMAALLVVASLLPLAIQLWISIGNARADRFRNIEATLATRGEMLVGRIDTFNDQYLRSAERMAHIGSAVALLQAHPAQVPELLAALQGPLQVWPDTDSAIRGAAILDTSGTVVAGTEPALVGVNIAYHGFVKAALDGANVISDIYLSEPEVGETPTLAFLAPVRSDSGAIIGAAAFWVHASVLTNLLRDSNGLAGEGSFGILFDPLGIRIAHSFLDELQFHPGFKLPESTIDAMVAERRFGARTRELLSEVSEVSWHERLAAGEQPDGRMFRGFAPGSGQWNYVVGKRCTTTAWTVYYLVPESTMDALMVDMLTQKSLFAAAIIAVALVVGALFAAVILRPVGQLSAAAEQLGAGNLDARVAIPRRDELGALGVAFNGMAARIQQQAAELQRESEDQFRKLFETMTEGFCSIEMIFDAAGNPVDFIFLEVNGEFEAQSGLPDVRGKRISEVAPELESYWLQLYGSVAVTGEPVQVDEVSPLLGRHFSVRAYRIGGDESRRVAILFSDVTDRKLAQQRQQAQLESLSLLQQITRAIGERQDLHSIFQVVVQSLERRLPIHFGCICLFEPAEARLRVACTGEHSRELAVKMGLVEESFIEIDQNGLSRCVRGHLVYEPDVRELKFAFPQRLAAGGLQSLVAAPLLVESQVFGVLIAARAGGGFSSAECEFLRQLSEHVALAAHQAQLYAALQEAYENLRQTQQTVLQQERLRALGQMASGIAHDINNAISPIALYTDSLLEREKQLSAGGRGQLETIQRAIHDVAATVSRMREFYRAREPEVLLTPVLLNDLVPQVVDLTRARWSTLPQQRGITIEQHTELQAGLPAIFGAENEIREALTNLVFNAVDAMPQGGRLTISTRAVGTDQVQVEVRDTGVGMDEDSRARCLEPFFTTKGERGTGLGLAMVYGMTQRHGAAIDIESAPGKGTAVRLLFRAAGPVVTEQQPVAAIVPRGLRILIIDDDPVLLRTLHDIFEQDGHTTVAASGGQQGIDLARVALASGQHFSLAITDLGMPHVDGRQVARALKAMAPQMPVILLTGWGQRLISEGDIPQDVDLVLSKPPKLRELREALARFTGEQRQA
jgi:signal transduction histidine kinase/ActR/RegA family two-component response regulator